MMASHCNFEYYALQKRAVFIKTKLHYFFKQTEIRTRFVLKSMGKQLPKFRLWL